MLPSETNAPSSFTISTTSPLTSAFTLLFSLYWNFPLCVEPDVPTSAVAICSSEIAPGLSTFIFTFLTIIFPGITCVAPLTEATVPLKVSKEP